MRSLAQDLVYGIRLLGRARGFTTAVALTLCVGIAGTTTMFTLLNAMLLRPYPFSSPERLMDVKEVRKDRLSGVSVANFLRLQNGLRSLDQITAQETRGFVVADQERSELVLGGRVAANFFGLLGVRPAIGRVFLPNEATPGTDRIVVLSDALWRRRFNPDSTILGRKVNLNAEPYTIIGVLPPEFFFFGNMLWVPAFSSSELIDPANRTTTVQCIARLTTNASLTQAQAEASTVDRQLREADAQLNRDLALRVRPIREAWSSNADVLLYLVAAGVFLMLIACANAANLMLARSESRHRELALRAALGAGRRRLIRQMLTESLLVATFGGLLGLLVTYWSIPWVVNLIPENMARFAFPGGTQSITLDPQVLLFTLGLTLLTVIVFGLAPALLASRVDLNDAIKLGSRSSAASQLRTSARSWSFVGIRGLLVIAEVSLSLILLFGTGLMIRTFLQLEQADRGVQWKNVLGSSIPFLPQRYPTPQSRESLARDVLRRIEALPGVESAAVSSFSLRRPFTLEAFSSIGADKEVRADVWVVSSGFFRTMRIPLLSGRAFSESDTTAAPSIAAVNRTMAHRYWPNESPLGKRLMFRNSPLAGEAPISLTIVGVVGDVRWMRIPIRPFDIEAQPTIYRPFLQSQGELGFLRVRAGIDPKTLVDPIRKEIRAVDPDIPVSITTPEHALDEEMARPRFNSILVIIFAIVALLLCTVGTFGVVAYSATLRTHEIGIRLALGAQRADILGLIVGWGVKLAFGGIAAGVLGSLALGRLAESQLYGVTGHDPASLIAASLGLVIVTLLASYLPARIATRVDPIVALRLD